MRANQPIVIAHRGASGYLPEHTLAAKALAHGMGADYLEQDVVLTSDAVPIVLHDIYLDSTTDVAMKFPGCQREDGHFYAMDFTLAQVRSLEICERREVNGANAGGAVYPQRFPTDMALFRIATLEEELDLIAGLDKSRRQQTGLYIEFKAPRKHREAGLDLSAAVMAVLDDRGLADKPHRVFLQCFDDKTLQHLRSEHKTALPLIQLIADKSWGEDSEADYDYLRSDAGLDYIAGYAQGIGPWLNHIYSGRDDQGKPRLDDLVARAQQRGLLVHPYTFRRDELPEGVGSFDELLDIFIEQLGVDGLFTDFPDLAVDYLRRRGQQQ